MTKKEREAIINELVDYCTEDMNIYFTLDMIDKFFDIIAELDTETYQKVYSEYTPFFYDAISLLGNYIYSMLKALDDSLLEKVYKKVLEEI